MIGESVRVVSAGAEGLGRGCAGGQNLLQQHVTFSNLLNTHILV